MRCRHCLGLRSVPCSRCRRDVPLAAQLMTVIIVGSLLALLVLEAVR